eukprot:9178940-Lingulodinium_polyedra.AAC.1
MAAQFSSAQAARPRLRPAAAAPSNASSMPALVCSPRRARTTRITASMGPTVCPSKLAGRARRAVGIFFLLDGPGRAAAAATRGVALAAA